MVCTTHDRRFLLLSLGEAKAKELIFRAKRLTADEALAVGLVNHSIPEGQSAMDKALEICRDIAANVS